MLIDLCGLLGQDVGTRRSSSTLAWEDRTPQPGLLPFGCLSKEGREGAGRWKMNHGQSWKEWGHLGPPFPRLGAKVLLFPRGPNAIIGCSHPDLQLGVGDSPMGPNLLCLLQGLKVDQGGSLDWPNCPLNFSTGSHMGPLKSTHP